MWRTLSMGRSCWNFDRNWSWRTRSRFSRYFTQRWLLLPINSRWFDQEKSLIWWTPIFWPRPPKSFLISTWSSSGELMQNNWNLPKKKLISLPRETFLVDSTELLDDLRESIVLKFEWGLTICVIINWCCNKRFLAFTSLISLKPKTCQETWDTGRETQAPLVLRIL